MIRRGSGSTDPRSRAASLHGGTIPHTHKLREADRDVLFVEQVISEVHSKWAALFSAVFAGISLIVLFYGLGSINRELDSQRADRSYEFVMLTFQAPYNDALESVIRIVNEANVLGARDPVAFSDYVMADEEGMRLGAVARLFAFYHNVGTCVALERCDVEVIRTGVTIGSKELIIRACPLIARARSGQPDYMRAYGDIVGADCDN